MDTRKKILTIEEAFHRTAGKHLKVISGYFDVLQPEMVQAMARESRPGTVLLALVLDAPTPVTSSTARAELAASLRVVDYVLSCDGDPAYLVERLQPAEWIRQEREHAYSTKRLIDHVIQRHSAEFAGSQGH